MPWLHVGLGRRVEALQRSRCGCTSLSMVRSDGVAQGHGVAFVHYNADGRHMGSGTWCGLGRATKATYGGNRAVRVAHARGSLQRGPRRHAWLQHYTHDAARGFRRAHRLCERCIHRLFRLPLLFLVHVSEPPGLLLSRTPAVSTQRHRLVGIEATVPPWKVCHTYSYK